MSTHRNIPQHSGAPLLSGRMFSHSALVAFRSVPVVLDRSWWPASRTHASDGRFTRWVQKQIEEANRRYFEGDGSAERALKAWDWV